MALPPLLADDLGIERVLTVSAYAVMTHCREPSSKPNSCLMVGSAMVHMPKLAMSTKKATHLLSRVRRESMAGPEHVLDLHDGKPDKLGFGMLALRYCRHC
jgi:hypothetical protein